MSQIFRGITRDGDWTFGKGRASYFRNDLAIRTDIETALKIFLGEIFWDLGTGVDWWNLLGGKNPAAQAGIILQTRQVINKVDGVVRINKVNSSLDVSTRKLTVTYNVDTIFSRQVAGSVAIA